MKIRMISELVEFRGLVQKQKKDGGVYYRMGVECGGECSMLFVPDVLVPVLNTFKKGDQFKLELEYSAEYGRMSIVGISLE